jgi:hypothetical protein
LLQKGSLEAFDSNDEIAAGKIANMFGSSHMDQTVRQAISICWMALPKDRKTPETVERKYGVSLNARQRNGGFTRHSLYCSQASVTVVKSRRVTTAASTNETKSRPRWFSPAWRDRAERWRRLDSTARPPGRPKKPRIIS